MPYLNNPTNSGTNYRLNFWLRPDADLESLVNALKPHCTEQEPEQPYQPNVTIIGRIEDQLLSEVAKMPGVSGSPHYIPANSHERRPIPYEVFRRATHILVSAYREHKQEDEWHAIDPSEINKDSLHNMCQMMAAEWIREHVAYPLNPSIEIPKYPEPDIVHYLARWEIRPQELFTQQDTIRHKRKNETIATSEPV